MGYLHRLYLPIKYKIFPKKSNVFILIFPKIKNVFFKKLTITKNVFP